MENKSLTCHTTSERRLIDANEVLKKQYNSSPIKALGFADMVVDVRDIEDAPTVDAVPVVHGRWEYRMVDPEYRYYKHECSICGFDGEDFYRYCPNCGAKMDGGNDQ